MQEKTPSDYGFFRVATAIPTVKVADVEYNLKQHIELIRQAHADGVQLLAFPELGMEALHLIKVDKYPAIIGAAQGRSIYD